MNKAHYIPFTLPLTTDIPILHSTVLLCMSPDSTTLHIYILSTIRSLTSTYFFFQTLYLPFFTTSCSSQPILHYSPFDPSLYIPPFFLSLSSVPACISFTMSAVLLNLQLSCLKTVTVIWFKANCSCRPQCLTRICFIQPPIFDSPTVHSFSSYTCCPTQSPTHLLSSICCFYHLIVCLISTHLHC